MTALHVGVNNYHSSASDVITIGVYKNTIATTMTCSVTTYGDGGGCTDSTHTFSVSPGDTLALGFTETNSSPYDMVTVGLTCQ